MLAVSNAHLAHGPVPRLRGTSLSLEAGERVALIGRNDDGVAISAA
jgi:ATP-binding cassette subfamily F protein uup